MTSTELLRPRVKVAINYPKSKFKVGDILTQHGNWFDREDGMSVHIDAVADCPEIFTLLQWWMDRAVSDMPEYVRTKFANFKGVYKIDEWVASKRFNGEYYAVIIDQETGCQLWASSSIPATAEEYEIYQQSKQTK